MDFGTLLSVAQKNENNKQSAACYQTKFAPPKKQAKQAKTLSENIKKFLARKEEEERQKALEEKKKKENLLALRDHKAQSRINKHLKVCKAANKSVLEDAIDNENTAVTIAGPYQPDEDDYGYVSQEASAFYNQLISKYNTTPSHNKILDRTKHTIKDIASTKNRVKQALKQQEEEEALGHRKKRKLTTKESDTNAEDNSEKDNKDVESEKSGKLKARKKQLPPPIDFSELLKIAERKQHEPIIIDVKPKTNEPERLLTKKQMKEYVREKEYRERKELQSKLGNVSDKEGNCVTLASFSKAQDHRSIVPLASKIPKIPEKVMIMTTGPVKAASKVTTVQRIQTKKGMERVSDKGNVLKSSERDMLFEERKKLESERKKLEEMRQAIEEEKKKLKMDKNKINELKNVKPEKVVAKTKVSEKQEYPRKVGNGLPETDSNKVRLSQLTSTTTKDMLMPNMKALKCKPISSSKEQKKSKRRILGKDAEEDEYDSELDDFIDDDIEEGTEDYSKYISEIFGYDKNRYRHVDNEDDTAMESSFAQQLKEEYVSTKIGIMEDLEDMRMEALEKKRKSLLKKKIKK